MTKSSMNTADLLLFVFHVNIKLIRFELVNDDRILNFGQTVPLRLENREQSVCVLFPPLDGAAGLLKRDSPALSPDQKRSLSPPPAL